VTEPSSAADQIPGAAAFADLTGQDAVVEQLTRAAAAAALVLAGERPEPGAMTHAWLFTGPPGSGRSVAARAFAAALLCGNGGCGECASCHQVRSGTHADLMLVRPEGLSYGVKQTRDLVLRAAGAPAGGRWQVVLFEDADRCTEQAANALLKAIEEPSRHTVWLLGIMGGVLLAVIVWVVVLGRRLQEQMAVIRQKLRSSAVLEERNRIAREMHDTVIQGCASASALLEAVVSMEEESSGTRRELLDSARSQIASTVDEARLAIWNLRKNESASLQIELLLENMAQQISHVSHVPVRFEVSGRPFPLDRAVGHVVLMVAREAVYNAVHHAQPQEVCIRVSFEANSMRMHIFDDGCGFDPAEVLAAKTEHFGLVGIRERIETVGGRFDLESAPGKGTQLSVELPVYPFGAKRRLVEAAE